MQFGFSLNQLEFQPNIHRRVHQVSNVDDAVGGDITFRHVVGRRWRTALADTAGDIHQVRDVHDAARTTQSEGRRSSAEEENVR